MLIKKSTTHNAIMLRPPPGVRFSIWGADVHLDFEKGREKEIVEWLRNWIDTYIVPGIARAEQQEQKAIAEEILTKAGVTHIEVETETEINDTDEPDPCGAIKEGFQCCYPLGHRYAHKYAIPVNL